MDSRRPTSARHGGLPYIICGCAVGAIIAAVACGTAPQSTHMPPAGPSDAPPREPPPPNPPQVSTLFGTAFEHSATGIHPAAAIPLRVWGGRNGSGIIVDVVTDAAGRYEVPDLEREFVQITVRPHETYLGPCSARLWQWTDGPIDVHVVSRVTLLTTGTPRTMPPYVRPWGYVSVEEVSGVVTEKTPDGVRGVPLAVVENSFLDVESETPDGYTVTNHDGHYTLCGYWDNETSQAIRVSKDGYRAASKVWPSVFSDFSFELVRN
jgi:hypothetical protein